MLPPCVCVCCFLPIHSGHEVRWMYQPGLHRRKVTQDFSSTFFLRCVPLFFSREGFSRSFPPSTVKSIFVVVVVVGGSHIQRIVLVTEETTVAQQVSHRLIKCRSRLCSQRGTQVNGSHRGDNPLLRLRGIQITTKSYATLQAIAPTNIKTVHQTSLLHTKSSLDRLGLLSPTHDQRSQQQSGQSTLQSVLINKSKFIKATHRTKIKEIEIPRSMVVEALSW